MKPLSKLVSVCLLIALLVGCSSKLTPTPTLLPEALMSSPTSAPPTQTPVPPTPTPMPLTPTPTPFPDNLTVTYLEAADWLVDLAEEDRDDQILDWTVAGLAGLLQLDVETLRDAFYDQVPVRDPLFRDMAANRSGSGRSLPDGQGGLNILVPVNDPYAARTIGMVLDDYRKDAGADPEEVTLRRYRIDHENKEVTLESDPPIPTRQVRLANGYQEMPVDTLDGLTDFLDATQHLSRLEIRNGRLWAGGWNWPGTPAGQITLEDLTVLQRGYLAALQGAQVDNETLPDLSGCPSLAIYSDALSFVEAISNVETLEELKALIESDPAVAQLFDPQEVEQLSTDLDQAQTDQELEQVLSSFSELLQERMDETLAAVDSSDCNLADALQSPSEPGFSLDPGQPLTVAELVSLLDPVDYPELAQNREIVDFLTELDEAETADKLADVLFSDFVVNELLTPEEQADLDYLLEQELTDEEFDTFLDLYVAMVLMHAEEALNGEAVSEATGSLPNPRKLGSVVVNALDDRPPYQFARYDGGLQGTEAGMTYFYTDLVAKAWSMEKGIGAPVGAVPGFVSDIQAKTPWSHCMTEEQQGRLWFGLRDEAVSATEDWVDLGSISARVFTLVDDPSGSGVEIEPSYSFGRIIWWWDDHYLPMADYEPQYHRLDQLMRWSTAIAWLADKSSVLLPEIPDDVVKRDWHFGDWLQAHPELKWQYDVPFIEPPGEITEAILTFYSEPLDDCGTTWTWSGGISNPPIQRIVEIQEFRPGLSPSIARAGLTTIGTDYSVAARAGTIATLDGVVKRVLGSVVGKTTTVDVTATGRKVWSLANVKAWVDETAPRQLSLEIMADNGQIAQRFSAQGLEVGELTVKASAGAATVAWRPGPLDQVRRVLQSFQDLLPGRSLSEAATETRGASLVYNETDGGRVFLRVDDTLSSRWVAIDEGLPDPGGDFVLLLGAPGAEPGAEPVWFNARMSRAPELPAGEDGATWLAMVPSRQGGAVTVEPAQPPGPTAGKLLARYEHPNREGSLHIDNNGIVARADDPVFGLDGTSAGRELMADPAAVEGTIQAQKAAQAANDGYQRAISLADESIVLVGTEDTIAIVPPGDPWHARLREVLQQTQSTGESRFKVQNDQALWVRSLDVPAIGNSTTPMTMGDVLKAISEELSGPSSRGPPIYLESGLASQMLEEGRLASAPIGVDLQVRVVQVKAPEWTRGAATTPDIWQWDRSEWVRPLSLAGGSPGGGAAGAGGSPGGTPVPAQAGTIRLAYLAADCDSDSSYERCD